MIFKKNRSFTLKVLLSKDKTALIGMDLQTVLLICREMNVLKQMWFGINVTEKEIINSNKENLMIHYDYNIEQKDILLLIRTLKDKRYLLNLSDTKKDRLMEVIITLGGCEIIEKRLEYDEKSRMERNTKQEMLDMEYAAKTMRPIQDKRHIYSWKTLIVHNYVPTTQENIRKIESDGYEFTQETTQGRMFFRKRRN
mgnify:CR=1 FL=1